MAQGTSYAIRNLTFSQPEADRQDVTFIGPQPEVRFVEDDQTDPAGRFRVMVNADALRLQRSNAAEWAGFDDLFYLDGGDLTIGMGGSADGTSRVRIFDSEKVSSLTSPSALDIVEVSENSVLVSDGVSYAQVRTLAPQIAAASAATVPVATSVRIQRAPIAGTNVTITQALALWVDSGASRFDGDILIDGAQVIQANGSAQIGISVNNSSLSVGSEGSLCVPVKTDTGAPNDADFGDVNGCFGFNSQDNTLEVRDGTDTYLSVGVAGYVIQRSVPPIEDGWYHVGQRVHMAPGVERIDEAACVVCGQEMAVGEQVTMWANAHVRDQDLHAVFGHLHLEENPEYQALKAEVERLRALVEEMRS